jgi:hemolysin-activating ACP:hemolysin acyltransferase
MLTESLKKEASGVTGFGNMQTEIASKLAKAHMDKAASGAASVPQAHMGQSFAQIVAVLMRDPHYRNLKIADLEQLVLPPVMAGQFKLAHGTRRADATAEAQRTMAFPVGVALWACVSPHIDQGLSENLDQQVWLRPAEWTSGDIIWLMAVAGYARTLPAFLKQLAETQFKDQQVKMRVPGPDGKVGVKMLR